MAQAVDELRGGLGGSDLRSTSPLRPSSVLRSSVLRPRRLTGCTSSRSSGSCGSSCRGGRRRASSRRRSRRRASARYSRSMSWTWRSRSKPSSGKSGAGSSGWCSPHGSASHAALPAVGATTSRWSGRLASLIAGRGLEGDSALEHVLELADVAWPRMAHEGVERFGRQHPHQAGASRARTAARNGAPAPGCRRAVRAAPAAPPGSR